MKADQGGGLHCTVCSAGGISVTYAKADPSEMTGFDSARTGHALNRKNSREQLPLWVGEGETEHSCFLLCFSVFLV